MSFADILAEIKATHDKKGKDYGTKGDTFANYRSAEGFGIPAWVSAALRADEKITRIKSFVTNGSLENEGVEESLLDLAVIGAIALTLYREQTRRGPDITESHETWVRVCDTCSHTPALCYCPQNGRVNE